jgi:hypothetical protein
VKKSIEELESALREAKEEARLELIARVASVVPQWTFAVAVDEREALFNRVYDDSCLWYRIEGTCTNREEAEAAGHSRDRLATSGMSYLFNTLSGRIVCSSGGGTYHFGGFDKNDPAHIRAINQISDFLVDNEEGGDITDIVAEYKATSK